MPKKNRKKAAPALPSQPHVVMASAPTPPAGWFYDSRLDLIIGCGAWSVPLLLLAYYSSSAYPQGLAIAFYALALVFNYPHYMATIYRAYRTPEDFLKYKVFTLHLTLLVGAFVILAHISHQLLAVVFTIYLTWSPFHYTGQNFGIALLFARRKGVKTTPELRRTFYLAFLSSYVMFFLAVHSFSSNDQFILTLGIPLNAARILWCGMLVIFVVSAISSLSAFVKQTSLRAMSAPIVLLSTQVAWFVIPTALTLFSNIDFLQARSTAGILAVMHSAQYLWITSFYARRESQAERQGGEAAPKSTAWRPSSYFLILMLGGIALFVPGPWLASRMLHIDFTASFLAITALVNIHHFILDGAIWKLRDGRIAALLLNTAGVENREAVNSRFSQITAWLTSPRKSARLFRVTAALSLLVLAGLDQLKFYYGAQASDAVSLRRAELLNPYDSFLQLRLARANERDGNQSENRTALEEAIRVNPAYRPAQVALAKLLIESGKPQEAYVHYKQMFNYLEPDVDSLVNFGLLAYQLDHSEEAINAWQNALKLDDRQPNAQLYLADTLANQKQFKEAIPHYQQYLALIADDSRPADKPIARPDPEAVLKVILQLAVTCQSAGEDDAALQFFSQGARLAEKAGDTQGLASALILSAEIKARHSRRAEALADFQRALLLEASSSVGVQAVNWFRYGRFLHQQKADARLVFASFTKAEVLLESEQNSADGEINKLRGAIQRELNDIGPAINSATKGAIKADLSTVLQDALTLKF